MRRSLGDAVDIASKNLATGRVDSLDTDLWAYKRRTNSSKKDRFVHAVCKQTVYTRIRVCIVLCTPFSNKRIEVDIDPRDDLQQKDW